MIHPEDNGMGQDPFRGLDDLKRVVREAHEKCYKARSPAFARLGQWLETIDTYAPIIDVMIQQQPFFVNLVWGSARFIIQVSSAIESVVEPCPRPYMKPNHNNLGS